MSIFAVAWQFDESRGNPAHRRKFFARLDGFFGFRNTGIDCVRLLSSGWDAERLAEHFREVLGGTDSLLILQVAARANRAQAWLTGEAWEWIEQVGGAG